MPISRSLRFAALSIICCFAVVLTGCKKEEEPEIEYRYAAVSRGELSRSISATGQVVALTTVDVKSKAGGKVVRLAVDEGAIVKKGDLVAIIDPSDTQAVFDQANADLLTASARADQAKRNYQLQLAQSETAVADARASLEAAKVRLRKAQLQAERQPSLTQASIKNAEASYDAAEALLEKLQQVTIPQIRREAASNLSQAKSSLSTAEAARKRQLELLKKGYVAQQAVDQANSNAETAKTQFEIAQQKQQTVEQDIRSQLRSAKTNVDEAKAQLEQARANSSEVEITMVSVSEASKAVRQSEIALQKAINDRMTNEVRKSDIQAAVASTVRNRVSLDNAKVQLDSTTVNAPRDGVVTQKYLEEGTIIPPGTSTFAQGTSLVQISDVTQLFIECAVDEADVASVRVGQKVHVTADAFRGTKFDGVVTRVNPAAKTENNITAVKVRVKVTSNNPKARLLPGMTATCEFLTLQHPNVLIVPAQAVQQDAGKATVRIKSSDPKKPTIREVKLGEQGNDGYEILEGLKEGEEVVTAELDMKELRAAQDKMKEVEEGGGLAGGGAKKVRPKVGAKTKP